MDFSAVQQALDAASAFELYRLRAAIDRMLDDPRRLLAIRQQLHPGMQIEYFDEQANALRRGRLAEMRRKQALVIEDSTMQRWLIPYTVINVDRVDVRIREKVQQGLGRNEVAIGETVGFTDRDNRERTGTIIRLNDKTVTMSIDGQQWRVAYQLLHRTIEAHRVVE